MFGLSFKEFLTVLEEGSGYCDFIKDPQIKKACKKLMKKSPYNRTYGGYWGHGTSGGEKSPSGGPGSMTGDGTGGGGATGTGAGTGTAGTGTAGTGGGGTGGGT